MYKVRGGWCVKCIIARMSALNTLLGATWGGDVVTEGMVMSRRWSVVCCDPVMYTRIEPQYTEYVQVIRKLSILEMHVVVVDVWAQGLETRLLCCTILEETINRVNQTGLVRLPVLQLSRRDATT